MILIDAALSESDKQRGCFLRIIKTGVFFQIVFMKLVLTNFINLRMLVRTLLRISRQEELDFLELLVCQLGVSK